MNDQPTLLAACREFRHAFGQFFLTLAYSLKVDRMVNFISRLIGAAISSYSNLNPSYAASASRIESERMLAELFVAVKDRKLATQINYLIEENARVIARSGFDSLSSVLEDLRHETRRRLSIYSADDVIVWLSETTTGEKLEEAQFVTYLEMMESEHVQ